MSQGNVVFEHRTRLDVDGKCVVCRLRPRPSGYRTCGLSECQQADTADMSAWTVRRNKRKYAKASELAQELRDKAIAAVKSRDRLRGIVPEFRVKILTSIPGSIGMVVLECTCGIEMRRVRKERDCTTAIWTCQDNACGKSVRLVEEQ